MSANCKPQDNTLIIADKSDIFNIDNSTEKANDEGNEVSCTKVLNKKKVRTPRQRKNSYSSFGIENFLHNNVIIVEHDYSKNDSWVQSEYLDDVIKHTSGAVIHSIIKKIHCETCVKMLKYQDFSKSKLTILKNWGGLQFAFDDVHLICHYTEKVL